MRPTWPTRPAEPETSISFLRRGRGAERVEALREGGCRGLVDGNGLAVAAREEALAQPRERLLPLREVGRMALEPLAGRPLALLVLADRASRGRPAPRAFAVSSASFDDDESSRSPIERSSSATRSSRPASPCSRVASSLSRCSSSVRILVASSLMRPDSPSRASSSISRARSASERRSSSAALRLQFGSTPLELRLATAESLLAAVELGLLPLLTPLQQVGLGDLGAQGGDPVLPLASRLQLAGDPVHSLLEPLLAVREVLLPLRETRGGLRRARAWRA